MLNKKVKKIYKKDLRFSKKKEKHPQKTLIVKKVIKDDLEARTHALRRLFNQRAHTERSTDCAISKSLIDETVSIIKT